VVRDKSKVRRTSEVRRTSHLKTGRPRWSPVCPAASPPGLAGIGWTDGPGDRHIQSGQQWIFGTLDETFNFLCRQVAALESGWLADG